MAQQQDIIVTGQLVGQTLAAAIKRTLEAAGEPMSWTQVRQLISARRVLVNDSLCLDEARRLTAGERIRVLGHSRARLPGADELTVLFVDPHLLVVDKPAGLLSERRVEEREFSQERKEKQPTLDELLTPIARKRLQIEAIQAGGGAGHSAHGQRAGGGAGAVQVRPVHRLDRDTSGLMIYALSGIAQKKLIELFAGHEVKRKYLAVVLGHPKARTIHSFLVRDRGDGLRGSLPAGKTDPSAQEAITHIHPIQPLGPYCLIECSLETGRTHQIRIHLAEIGHPLCGERLYTHALGQAPLRDTSHAPRQALHSCELELSHPITGEALHFASPLPADLAGWIKRLR